MIFISLFFPLWGVDFTLRNQADAVHMRVYFNKVTGHLQTLITLGGYFGVHLPFEIDVAKPLIGTREKGIMSTGLILFPELQYFKIALPATGALCLLAAALRGRAGRIMTYVSASITYIVVLAGLIYLKIENSKVYLDVEDSIFILPGTTVTPRDLPGQAVDSISNYNPFINPGLWGTVEFYSAKIVTRPFIGSLFVVIALLAITVAVLYAVGYSPVERITRRRLWRRSGPRKFLIKDN